MGINPAYVEAGELMQLLMATNWVRDYIPFYAELIAPLSDLLRTALAKLPKRTKAAASRVSLAKLGWNCTLEQAFNALKAAVANSTTVAFPDLNMRLCLFTDASDTHWAATLTQVPASHEKRDLSTVSDWGHQPLAFLSGAFKGASLRWSTCEKEAFAIVEASKKLAHFLITEHGFGIYIDHRNLQYILDPAGRTGGVTKPLADRLERWGIYLNTFQYRIHHVRGEENVWADLLSRWAAESVEILKARERLKAVRMRVRGGRVSVLENIRPRPGPALKKSWGPNKKNRNTQVRVY